MIHTPKEKRANWLAIHRKRQQKYLDKLKKICMRYYGSKCNHPDCKETTKLEFAHLLSTNLRGVGRGKQSRLLDVYKHFACYTLLCHKHHHELDHSKKEMIK